MTIIQSCARRDHPRGRFSFQDMEMGRLKQLAPRIGGAKARVQSTGAGPDRLARRDATVPWRKWYKTAEWQRLRWQRLKDDGFTCRMCGWFGGAQTRLLVADHIRPHRGERALFFDFGNLQTLCKSCHDSAKQRAERSAP